MGNEPLKLTYDPLTIVPGAFREPPTLNLRNILGPSPILFLFPSNWPSSNELRGA